MKDAVPYVLAIFGATMQARELTIGILCAGLGSAALTLGIVLIVDAAIKK